MCVQKVEIATPIACLKPERAVTPWRSLDTLASGVSHSGQSEPMNWILWAVTNRVRGVRERVAGVCSALGLLYLLKIRVSEGKNPRSQGP